MTEETLDNPIESGPSEAEAQTVQQPATETGSEQQSIDDSIATSSGEDVTAPQDWPDNWRQLLAGDDEKSLKQAERFKSPQDVWKSFREAQKLASSRKPATPAPTAESSPEEIAAYRQENGIPESPDGYDLDFEDGTVIGDEVKEQLSGFLEFAHNNNSSPESVKATVQWYLNDVQQNQERIATLNDEAKINGITDLKSEWGAEYQSNINAIPSLFTNAPEGAMSSLLNSRNEDGIKFGNNPDNVRWLVGLAKELNPTVSLVPPGPDQAASIDAEIQKIQGWMNSPDKAERNKYWDDPSVQDRYVKLMQAKQQ